MENGVQDTGPPPPSPLTGCYLLIVVGEPHTQEHKNIILQRIAKGLLSWDIADCLIDLEKELAIITEQALEGEETRYGERLIQYASENLVTEILIHPAVSTLAQCIRNLLSSFTRHRHIIHAGYTFAANGSWILQDGTFSSVDFSEAFQEIEVQRVVRAYENSISLDIHCSPEGDWSRLSKEPLAKYCKIRLNPVDVLNSGSPPITNFLNYVSPYLIPAELENILECSDVVGNIRFSHPTLYIFPGGQGDAALFGINGFNMLLDGGFSRKACFWDFVRHLDRLDAVLMTRLNNGNVNGLSAVVRRKMQNALYPQIGHFFCNIQERKSLLSPDGDKDKDPLLINLMDEGQDMMANLKKLNLNPQSCYRDSDPINLYHKVGHGTLDMYVLSPAKDSKEVREFLYKWNNNDQKMFSSTQKTKDFQFPLQNLVSICCLLVWQPANPNDNITRILYPGSTPQHKVFEGLDRLKNLEYIKHPICSESKLTSSIIGLKSKVKDNSLEKIIADQKKIKEKQPKPAEIKKIENKDTEITNGVEETEKTVKKSDSTDSEKSLKDRKKPIKKEEKPKPKPKIEAAKPEKKKPLQDKKPSPTTPKKTIAEPKVNGEPKPKPKLSPSATPAKSAKEATNRKVIESKKQAKKEPPKQPEKPKEPKAERKPISRRTKAPSPAGKTTGSPAKKLNGAQKPDSIIKKAKLDKEGTTDSSTVSTPSADQKDITKLTPEEIEQMKAQELADLKEEQEVVKEIEAVFRKGEVGKDNDTELRKVKDISIEDKTEPEEYLIIEKEEVEPVSEDKIKEDETQKLTRDSEESEKVRKLSDEIKLPIKPVEEVVKEETKKEETQISATTTEERLDISSEKKMQEGELHEQNVALESQPDEKFSTTVESGATTAPTLPEDERITLDEIKEDEQIIEEKHVKEDTKEKEVPIIQLPPQSAESSPKIPPIAGIKLEKQTPIRDIVKTPDEVADLPMHEEADIDQYPMDVMKTSLKAEDLKLDAKKDEKQEKIEDKSSKEEDKEKTDESKEVLQTTDVKDIKKEEEQKEEPPKEAKEDMKEPSEKKVVSPAEDTSNVTEIVKISDLPISKDIPIEDLLPTPPQEDIQIEDKTIEKGELKTIDESKINKIKMEETQERKQSIVDEATKPTVDKENEKELSIVPSIPQESDKGEIIIASKQEEAEEVPASKEESKSSSPSLKIEERKSSIISNDEITKEATTKDNELDGKSAIGKDEDRKTPSPSKDADRKLSVSSVPGTKSPTPPKDEKREESKDEKPASPTQGVDRKLSVALELEATSRKPTEDDKLDEDTLIIEKHEDRRTPSPSKDADRKLSVSSVAGPRSPTPPKDNKIEESQDEKPESAIQEVDRRLSVSSVAGQKSPTPSKDDKIEESKDEKPASPTQEVDRKLSVSSAAGPRSPTPPKDDKIEENQDEKAALPTQEVDRKLSVSSVAGRKSPTPPKDDKVEESKDEKPASPIQEVDRRISVSSVAGQKSPTPSKDDKIEESKDEKPEPAIQEVDRKLSVSSVAGQKSPTPSKDDKIEESKDEKPASPTQEVDRKLSGSSVTGPRSPTPPKDDKIEENKDEKPALPTQEVDRKLPVSSVAAPRSSTSPKDDKIEEAKGDKPASPTQEVDRKLSVSSAAGPRSPTPPKDDKIEESKGERPVSPTEEVDRKLSVSSVAGPRSPTPPKDDKIEESKGEKPASPTQEVDRRLSVSSAAGPRSPTPSKDDKIEESKDEKPASPTQEVDRKLSVSSVAGPRSPTPSKDDKIDEGKAEKPASPTQEVDRRLSVSSATGPRSPTPSKDDKIEESKDEKPASPIPELDRKLSVALKQEATSPTPAKDDKHDDQKLTIEKDEDGKTPSPSKDADRKLSASSVADTVSPTPLKDDEIEGSNDENLASTTQAVDRKLSVSSAAGPRSPTPPKDDKLEESKDEKLASTTQEVDRKLSVSSAAGPSSPTPPKDDKIEESKDEKPGSPTQEVDRKSSVSSVTGPRSPTPPKDDKIEETKHEKPAVPTQEVGRKLSVALEQETASPTPTKDDKLDEQKLSIVKDEDRGTPSPSKDSDRKLSVSSVAGEISPTPQKDDKIEESKDEKPGSQSGEIDRKLSDNLQQEATSPTPTKDNEVDEQKLTIEKDEDRRTPSPSKDADRKLSVSSVAGTRSPTPPIDDKGEETKEPIVPSMQDATFPSKDEITEESKPSTTTKSDEDIEEKLGDKPEEKKDATQDNIKDKTQQAEDIDVSQAPKEEILEERKQSIIGTDLGDQLSSKDIKAGEKEYDQPEKGDEKTEEKEHKTIEEKIDVSKDLTPKVGTTSPIPSKQETKDERKPSIITSDIKEQKLQSPSKEAKLSEALKFDEKLEDKKCVKEEKTEDKVPEKGAKAEEKAVTEKLDESKETINEAAVNETAPKEDKASPLPPKQNIVEERKPSITGKELEEQRIPSPTKDVESKDLKFDAKAEQMKDEKQEKLEDKPQQKQDEKIDSKLDIVSTISPKEDKIEEKRIPSPSAEQLGEKKDDEQEKIEDKTEDKKTKVDEELVLENVDLSKNKVTEGEVKDVTLKVDTTTSTPQKEDIIMERKQSIATKDLEEQRTKTPSPTKVVEIKEDTKQEKIEDKPQEKKEVIAENVDDTKEKLIQDTDVKDGASKSPTPEEIIKERKPSIIGKEEQRIPSPVKDTETKLGTTLDEKIDDEKKEDKQEKTEDKPGELNTISEQIDNSKEDRKPSIITGDLGEQKEASPIKADTRSPTPPIEIEERQTPELSAASKEETTSPLPSKQTTVDDKRPSIVSKEADIKLDVDSKSPIARSPTPSEDTHIKVDRKSPVQHLDEKTEIPKDHDSKLSNGDAIQPLSPKTKEPSRSPSPSKDVKLADRKPSIQDEKISPTLTKEEPLGQTVKETIEEKLSGVTDIKDDIVKAAESIAKDIKDLDGKYEESKEEKDIKNEKSIEKEEIKHEDIDDTKDYSTKKGGEGKEAKDIKSESKLEASLESLPEKEDLKQEEVRKLGNEAKMAVASKGQQETAQQKEESTADKPAASTASAPETKEEKGDAEKEVQKENFTHEKEDIDKDSPLQNGSISDYSMEDNKQIEEIAKARHTKEETKDQKPKGSLHIQEQDSRSGSLTESPDMSTDQTLQTFKEAEVIDKMELGRKSPKEREEDVAIIVASVAQVLKSDAPLEEFEGKLPLNIAPFAEYTTYTTELRETHITTLDSPVTEKIDSNIIQETIPEQDEERRGSKALDLIKESKEFMETTSKIISDIKQAQPDEKIDDADVGTVHRMLVTASSEDGGEETEICPKGTINFSKSSESSGRSSPDLNGQKLKDVDRSSGKSTPDIKVTSDLEKADLEDNEKVFKDNDDDVDNTKDNDLGKTDKTDKKGAKDDEPGKITPEPLKSDTSTPDLEKSSASTKEKSPSPDSGLTETTKEAKGGSTSSLKEVTKPESEQKDPFDSGRSTPEFKDDKPMDALEKPHLKAASDSGRSTPDTKSLDELKQASGKSTPDLKEQEKKKAEEIGDKSKDAIPVKEDDKSGTSTPSLQSGKNTPDLKVDDLSKSSTPDLKIDQSGPSLKDEIKAADAVGKEETRKDSLVGKLEDTTEKKDDDEIPPSYDSCQRIEHKGEEKIEKTEGAHPEKLDLAPVKDEEDNFVHEVDEKKDVDKQPEAKLEDKIREEAKLEEKIKEESKCPIPEVDRSKTPSPLPRAEGTSSVESKSISPSPVPSKPGEKLEVKETTEKSESKTDEITTKSPSPIPSKPTDVPDGNIIAKKQESSTDGKEEIGMPAKDTPKEEKEVKEAKLEAKSSVIVGSVEEAVKQGIKTDKKTEKVSSMDIKETVKDFLAAEISTPYLSTAGTSKDEPSTLSGKSTPDIADVERFKDIQETLKYEKHIPGHSTPPTVPVSPIVKDIMGHDLKPTTIATIKEQDLRSSTPGSDDLSQISRSLLESETRESDDEDILGSPTSVTSQIGHSPQYDFEDEKKSQKQDPMSVSFYGSLPGDKPDKFLDDTDLDFEKALQEHRQARGEDLTSEGATYLHEVPRKVDAKAKEASLMTSSFIGTELPTHHEEDKEDPIASWGKPLGLPSPAPPGDNKGTPKKEKKLPANVSAKNKLNDDRKRSESPSKYDKKKKYNPIYVDLTYVPHHGNANYSYVDFFKRVRARYYVFSGIEPSKEVYNGLLEAKQTWEDKDLEVTIIPTYDTDVLGYWVAENDELLTKCKIDLSPSASRCTINLQDHETSCSAYRLEF